MSSACTDIAARASEGVAPALRAVDCLAGETVASAFARLFGSGNGGSGGALLPALTILLTLYVGLFAVGLLTGRSRLGIGALTPRMLTLGLVLTFATSWVAYSQVVWNLATGAPDEVAAVLTGAPNGASATQIFGDKVDLVFGAIAEAADAGQPAQAAQPTAQGAAAGAAAQGAASGSFTPANLMWLGALLLLLGTVGVLVTARIALAVLLAVGPVFVVFALFTGTRGLFVGWLRALVLMALVPLFVVVGGSVVLELLVPVVASLRQAAELQAIDGRAALALFVIACVHLALMALVLKVAGTTVSAWQVFGLAAGARERGDGLPLAAAPVQAPPLAAASLAGRRAAVLPAASLEVLAPAHEGGGIGRSHATHVTQVAGGGHAGSADGRGGLPPLPRARARGIGSRFAAPQQGRAGGMLR